jgi:hypothetical protein
MENALIILILLGALVIVFWGIRGSPTGWLVDALSSASDVRRPDSDSGHEDHGHHHHPHYENNDSDGGEDDGGGGTDGGEAGDGG